MEASVANIKMVKNLESLKHRRETGMFKVEGTKAVLDTVGAFSLEAVFATQAWIDAHRPEALRLKAVPVKAKYLERMSSLTTAPEVIAVCLLPKPGKVSLYELAREDIVLALDTIQDPGNLGTIIRTADWFGVHHIFCSEGTTDAFSPKVVQATMGALARVKVHYCPLADELNRASSRGIRIYGTLLDGENIYRATLSATGVIIVGNEGRGISAEVKASVTDSIRIPSYPAGEPTSESLNAAVATAVTLAEFRRR